MSRCLSLLVCLMFVSPVLAADNERYSASAAIEAQDITFQPIVGGDYQFNPAAYGDPPLPGGISASFSNSGSDIDGSTFGGSATASVDPVTPPAGAAPIMRVAAAGQVDLISVGQQVFAFGVNAGASWEFDVTATGPGGVVYMVPTFRVDGTLTGSGSAVSGGASLTAFVTGGGFHTLAGFNVPTDGSLMNIDTTSTGMGIPLAIGETKHILFNLGADLRLIDFGGVTTPYAATADANFSNSAQLIGLQFFADENLTEDISTQITLAGGGAVNLQSLVVPEPTSLALMLTAGVLLCRRR